MNSTPLKNFRQKFPEYNDMDDEALAEALHKSHYSDMPTEEFRQAMGLQVESTAPPSVSTRIDNRLNEKANKDPLATSDSDLQSLAKNKPVTPAPVDEHENTFLGNAVRRAAERGSTLLGHAMRGVERLSQPAGDSVISARGAGPLGHEVLAYGQISFGTDWGDAEPSEGKYRVRTMNKDEHKAAQSQKIIDRSAEYLTSRDFGYIPRATAEKIKSSYNNGEVAGTIGNVFAFGIEQGIGSIPDMVAALNPYSLVPYIVARSDEIGTERAINKTGDENAAPELQEQLEAMPAAIGSALFERFGAKKITEAFGFDSASKVGQDVLEKGLLNASKRVGKKALKAGAAEGVTEFVQEGMIEYLGERLGTGADMNLAEAGERGLFGFLGGASFGSMAGAAGATINEVRSPLRPSEANESASEENINSLNVPHETDPRIQQPNNRVALAEMADRSNDPMIRKTVARALAGREMGVQQKRQLQQLLDSLDAEGKLEGVDAAADDMQQARQTHQEAHMRAKDTTQSFMRDPNPLAGELQEESEYLPDQIAESRIAYDLATELDALGAEVEAQVDQILNQSETNKEAIERLEVLKHEQQRPETDTASTPSQEATQTTTATEGDTGRDSAGITAWHGSPHEFESFSLVKIGSGEGAQAYGHGLYFADSQQGSQAFKQAENGYTYQVKINASKESDFLDWGLPINQQSESIQQRLAEAGLYDPTTQAELTGKQIYYQSASDATTQEAATEAMKSAGIKGLQYQDAQTRSMQGSAKNYVVFDESLINIVDRNGEPVQPKMPGDRRSESRGDDRRQNEERRKRIEQMTPAEIVEELYTDPLTGLYNERAFNEDLASAKFIASIDADGLGGVNDHLGHDAGDGLLKAVGIALEETGVDAYHKSGDEFYLIGDNEAEVQRAVNQAQQTLAAQVLEASQGKVEGINITAGIGRTKNEADTVMEASKKTRAEQGLRNPKGTLPPGGVLYSKRDLDLQAGTNYVGAIGRSGELPINANKEYVLGNGRTVRIPEKPVSRRHIMNKLQRLFNVKIFQGRVKMPAEVQGYYRLGVGEIRIRKSNDLETTAHEVAHWMDYSMPWISKLYKQFKSEVITVSYDDKLLHEGWAEFMRLWMTQDYMARQATPGFYDAFMKALDERPELRDKLYQLQELMHAWHLQGRRARLVDRIGNNISIADRFHAYYDKIREKALMKVFDDLRPLKEAERVVRGEVAPANESGYSALRLARGAHGVMQAVLHKGTIIWNEDGDLDYSGKGINEIFAPVADRMEDMMLYMVARRAKELLGQGREHHIRPDEIQAGLEIGQNDPAIREVFNEWLAFNDRMMDFYEQSGLLSGETRKAIEEMNKNYVPFNRIVESAMGSKVNHGGSPFMRLKGGTSNINDVFESIVGNTSQMVHMALVNRGKANFYRMISNGKNEQAGRFAAPIKKDVHVSNVDKEQVLDSVLQGLGYSMKDYRRAKNTGMASKQEMQLVNMVDTILEGMADTITFFRNGKDPTGNVDFYLDNGNKYFYEIADPLLMDAINLVGPRPYNLAMSMLGGFANILRKGVTVTPTFQMTNFIRDTMNAFTLSKGKIVPAAGAMKALGERIYNDEHYWEYMLNGGGFAAMADADGINRDRILDSQDKIMRALDTTLGSFEYANRIAEYKALRKKGWTKRDAALAGREISSDFAMRGSSEILRWFTTSIPFLNARLQGAYRNARELAELDNGKVRFVGATAFSYALRSLTAITIPSLILYMMNRDDERYQAIPDWRKDLAWIIFTGDGEDDYVMIPKPFETGMAWGTLPERMIEYYYENDEKELADAMLWMATETFNLNMVPQAYKVWDDLAKNKNFTGAPIIPSYLEGMEPMEQYRFYTSDAMIALGRKYNISPLKAEYIVRGHFGTLGGWALGIADYMVGDIASSGQDPTKTWKSNVLLKPFVNDGPLRRTDAEDDLWEMLRESQKVASTVRMMMNRSPERLESYLSIPKKQAYLDLNKVLSQATRAMQDLSRAADRIRTSPDMSGDEKRAAIDDIKRQRNAIARDVRKNINPEEIDKIIEEIENAQRRQPAND